MRGPTVRRPGFARPVARVKGAGVDVRTAPLRPSDFWNAMLLFLKDNALGMSGMVAFFGFLSVVPLAILFLAIVGNALSNQISVHDVRKLFAGVMPGLSQQQFLDTYWKPIRHSRVATTILGAVSLLLGTSGLHDSVDWAVNRIWRVPHGRPFWLSKLRGLGVIVWVTIFVVLSVGLSWLAASGIGLAHAPSDIAGAGAALLPPLLLDALIFGALYKLTPMVPVNTGVAATAGLIGAILWDVSKFAFGWWVIQAGTYNRVYGPLSASIIVMFWLWISGMIFLYGACLAYVIQQRRIPAQPTPGGS